MQANDGPMAAVFAAPGKYIQGRGATGTLGEVLEQVVGFCLRVGLPVSLEDIGAENAGREELESVAEAACVEGETIHNMPFEIQPQMLVDAMIAAPSFGRQRRAALQGEASLPAVAH